MAITLNGTTGISNDGGYTGDGVSFADTTPANTLVTTTGGNVGIGTSSFALSTKLQVRGSTANAAIMSEDTAGTTSFVRILGDATAGNLINWKNGTALRFAESTDGFDSFAERMRINSDGRVYIGQTSASLSERLGVTNLSGQAFYFNGSTGCGAITNDDLNHYAVTFSSKAFSAATHFIMGFFRANGSTVGSITHNDTNTTYGTTSDYRLKKDVAPMIGALNKVAQLKPCTYTWKFNDTEGEGFIAHELQEVFPNAVVGEKDAVNEDGSIKPQSIDTSFLVATLTAAIQEQQAIIQSQAETITAMEARLTALENNNVGN
jgi:hypothetical protein